MKRKKRFQAAHEEGDAPEFQVAPMADMLFVLLVFFMSITSTEVLQKVANLELAKVKDAPNKDGQKSGGEVVINVLWNGKKRTGKLDVQGREYGNPTELVPYLSEQLGNFPDLRVLVRADKGTEYSFIADVMRACRDAQIGNVTFSVLTGGQKGPADAAEQGGAGH
jgi:biopolymer transport protein ExbD